MWLYNVPPDTGNSQKSGTECLCVCVCVALSWEIPSEEGNNKSHCGFSVHLGLHNCMCTLSHTHTSGGVSSPIFIRWKRHIFISFSKQSNDFHDIFNIKLFFFSNQHYYCCKPPPPAMLTHLLSLRYDVKVWLQSDRLAGTLEKYTSKTVVRFRMRHIKSYYFN